jgi:hypothetical protein
MLDQIPSDIFYHHLIQYLTPSALLALSATNRAFHGRIWGHIGPQKAILRALDRPEMAKMALSVGQIVFNLIIPSLDKKQLLFELLTLPNSMARFRFDVRELNQYYTGVYYYINDIEYEVPYRFREDLIDDLEVDLAKRPPYEINNALIVLDSIFEDVEGLRDYYRAMKAPLCPLPNMFGRMALIGPIVD